MTAKLICFDLDDTLINGRLHHSLEEAGVVCGQADEETVSRHVEQIGGVKNRRALQKTLRDLLNNNVNIAITSYTGYAESIPTVLKMIGLSDAEIARIKCASFSPPRGPNGEKTPGYGKNHHIEYAIEAFGEELKPSEVVLVDDRMDHYELAKQKGYNVVWVQGGEGRVDYLNEVRELAGLSTALRPAIPLEDRGLSADWVNRLMAWAGVRRTSTPGLN